jgi:hypothetical protein
MPTVAYVGVTLPAVHIKIMKRNPSIFWYVQLANVEIFRGGLSNTPGFERYDLRYSGAFTIADNRPAAAKG